MSERLTYRNSPNGEACLKYGAEAKWRNMPRFDLIKNAMQKLAEYEDLEEKGLLLRLPCKENSTVFLISSRYTKCSKYGEEFDEYNCQGCEDECDSYKEYYIHTNMSVNLEWIVRNINKFGKTVFLTQSEAEKKLKELQKDGE